MEAQLPSEFMNWPTSPALLWVDGGLCSIVREQYYGEEGMRGCAWRDDLLERSHFLALAPGQRTAGAAPVHFEISFVVLPAFLAMLRLVTSAR
jgi:hypothetical protein